MANNYFGYISSVILTKISVNFLIQLKKVGLSVPFVYGKISGGTCKWTKPDFFFTRMGRQSILFMVNSWSWLTKLSNTSTIDFTIIILNLHVTDKCTPFFAVSKSSDEEFHRLHRNNSNKSEKEFLTLFSCHLSSWTRLFTNFLYL